MNLEVAQGYIVIYMALSCWHLKMASRACLQWPHAIACIAKNDFAVN